MFSYSPNKPPICDVSYNGPLRQRQDSPIHPFLHDVQIVGCDTRENRHQLTAAQGGNDTSSTKVCNINSHERNSNLTDVKHDVDNCQEPHQSPKSSTNVYPAPERAACVPDTRFVRVSAVLAEIGGAK